MRTVLKLENFQDVGEVMKAADTMVRFEVSGVHFSSDASCNSSEYYHPWFTVECRHVREIALC